MGCCVSNDIDMDDAYSIDDLIKIVKEKTKMITREENELKNYYDNQMNKPLSIDVDGYSKVELQEHYDYLKEIIPLLNLAIKRLEVYKPNLPFKGTKTIVERILLYTEYFSKTIELLTREVNSINELAMNYYHSITKNSMLES